MIVRNPVIEMQRPAIGIVGSGFIARQFAIELHRRRNFADQPRLAGYLTRRNPAECSDLPEMDLVTTSTDALIDKSDIIFECSGDPYHATLVIERAMQAGKPVMTLNPEFHVTTGSYFANIGYLTEADGDQPGCLASLREEAVDMGFEPLVYGNMKGFLNRTPNLDDMTYWGERQGISLPMVTSFTDGTKVQIEQVLVGNAFGAGIAREDMLGPAGDELPELATDLARAAEASGGPITDYVLSRALPHGVFITGRHADAQSAALNYIKMGEGPFYTLIRNNILVHLEPFKTIRRMRLTSEPLLNNNRRPHLSVAALAKRELSPGEFIKQGCGSFDLRGTSVRIAERVGHLPIGLAAGLRVKRRIEAGAIINFDDVDLEPHRAIELWQKIEESVLASGNSTG